MSVMRQSQQRILVAWLRGLITAEVRIPAFVLIIATLVTIVDLAMNAWLHALHKVLGLFIPLIVVNCLFPGRAESFACKNSVALSALDGLAMGLRFTFALTLMGALREIGGSSTVFSGATNLLGPAFAALEMRVLPRRRRLGHDPARRWLHCAGPDDCGQTSHGRAA